MNYLFPIRGHRETTLNLWLLVWGVFMLWLLIGAVVLVVFQSILPANAGTEWQFAIAAAQYIPFWLLVWFAPKLVGRKSATLLGDSAKPNWNWFGKGFILWFAVLTVASAIEYSTQPANFQYAFNPGRLWLALAVAFLFLPIQTSAEELFFRGLIPQAISNSTRNRWLIVGISSVLFGIPHLANPEAEGALVSALFAYGLIGASWGYAAVRVGRLEVAIGAHLANNLFGLLIVGYADSALPSLAIWNTPAPDLNTVAVSAFVMFLIWAGLINRLTRGLDQSSS